MGSVANFKTRKGSNAGLKVTLRKNKMYEFIDRLVNIALPRIKDFRGLSPKGFGNFGNYTFGVKEHIIFPEVSFDRADKVRGLDIVVVPLVTVPALPSSTSSVPREGACPSSN